MFLFSSPTDVESHNPPPLGTQRPCWHRLVSGSSIICNSPSILLTDIVCFGLLCIVVSLTVLKRVCPYKECFVPLSNQCGISQSTPLGAQRPCWHRPMSGSNTICNSPSTPIADIVRFGLLHIVVSLTVLKHVCPCKECFVPLSNQCRISQSTLLRSPTSLLASPDIWL